MSTWIFEAVQDGQRFYTISRCPLLGKTSGISVQDRDQECWRQLSGCWLVMGKETWGLPMLYQYKFYVKSFCSSALVVFPVQFFPPLEYKYFLMALTLPTICQLYLTMTVTTTYSSPYISKMPPKWWYLLPLIIAGLSHQEKYIENFKRISYCLAGDGQPEKKKNQEGHESFLQCHTLMYGRSTFILHFP